MLLFLVYLLSSQEEEIARPSAVKISSSPQKSYSRSFSRLSFEDSYDDSEFSGPFVVDDDDLMDHGSRYVSITLISHNSWMLSTYYVAL